MYENANVIIEQEIHILEIETAISNAVNNIEIETLIGEIIELSTDAAISTISAGDILGLDTYIGNFIDLYQIDCGTP